MRFKVFFFQLAAVLAAINIVLLILIALQSRGFVPRWAPVGEPDRLNTQLSPDFIRVLPPGASTPAAASAPVSAPITVLAVSSAPVAADSPPAAEQSPSAAQSTVLAEAASAPAPTPSVEVDENKCVVVKGLSDEAFAQMAARAGKVDGKLKTKLSTPGATTYWVHIPPDGGKEGAEKRLEVLQRNNVDDYLMVRDAGENQYAISLGLFHDEALAKRRLATLRDMGFSTPIITVRSSSPQRLEISGAGSSVDKFLAGQERRFKDKPFQRESCGGGR